MSKFSPPQIPFNGICDTCRNNESDNNCSMVYFLGCHYDVANFWKTLDYRDEDPANWDDLAIDDPEIINGIVEWCPMYSKP